MVKKSESYTGERPRSVNKLLKNKYNDLKGETFNISDPEERTKCPFLHPAGMLEPPVQWDRN